MKTTYRVGVFIVVVLCAATLSFVSADAGQGIRNRLDGFFASGGSCAFNCTQEGAGQDRYYSCTTTEGYSSWNGSTLFCGLDVQPDGGTDVWQFEDGETICFKNDCQFRVQRNGTSFNVYTN